MGRKILLKVLNMIVVLTQSFRLKQPDQLCISKETNQNSRSNCFMVTIFGNTLI